MNKLIFNKEKLKLIKNKGQEGYFIDNIKDVLGTIAFKEFEDWIIGQTVGDIEGRVLIYKQDFNRFIKGLPVID